MKYDKEYEKYEMKHLGKVKFEDSWLYKLFKKIFKD